MKICLIQMDIAWADVNANLQTAEHLVAGAEKADVYVLPEMFTTGFIGNPEEVAGDEVAALDWMRCTAARLDAAVCGSMAVRNGDRFSNRFFFVKPDGNVAHYDKRHLFAYGGEHKHYERGSERVVVEFRGVRMLLQVCYDLRFPVFSRNRKDYDVALYVASWPVTRLAVWNTLLHARAIENQCYVVGVNRVGCDPACQYSGGSMLVDAYGKTVAECESGKECALTVQLDLEKLASFRKKFPVLDDAD